MFKDDKSNLILLILTFGVFGIINTEMGVVGLLPMLADHFQVSISQTGLFVSLFALVVAISGPITPLLFSRYNRKFNMIFALSCFVIGNLVQAFTSNFILALIARIIPAFLHPVYISQALVYASSSIDSSASYKNVAKVMVGVSAGMVLGVPIVSFIASSLSLTAAMLFFAFVNGLVLIATFIFMPDLQIANKVSYSGQLKILTQPIVWLSIIGIVFLNGSIFGVYSFLSEYLRVVSQFDIRFISFILFIYGMANILGNIIAGKALSSFPIKFILFNFIPTIFIYLIMYFWGQFQIFTCIIVLSWGIVAGIIANINQYWITSVSLKAPEFGNGLFLAATNLGTTIGTSICGWIIANSGINHVFIGGISLLLISFILLGLRVFIYKK